MLYIEETDEAPVIPNPPTVATLTEAPPNSCIARIRADENFLKLTGFLLTHLVEFRRYEASRRCDTVSGAEERVKAIEAEMAKEAPYMPLERVRELQGELARLHAVSPGTEDEMKRSVRARGEIVYRQFRAWCELVLRFAEGILDERQRHVAAFARNYGMERFPTPITGECEALIREITGYLQTAQDEVECRPRVLNEGEVRKLGAMPVYSTPPIHRTPSVRPALSALKLFGVDCSAVYAAVKAQD